MIISFDNTNKNLKLVAKKLDIVVKDRVIKTRSKLNSRIDKFKSKNYEIIKDLSLYNVPKCFNFMVFYKIIL